MLGVSEIKAVMRANFAEAVFLFVCLCQIALRPSVTPCEMAGLLRVATRATKQVCYSSTVDVFLCILRLLAHETHLQLKIILTHAPHLLICCNLVLQLGLVMSTFLWVWRQRLTTSLAKVGQGFQLTCLSCRLGKASSA